MYDWKMRREEVVKLITAYRKLRCLWDYRSSEYKLYDLKKRAWQKLGKLFGKEVHIVKRKIKCLRAAYGSEKRKVDDSYGSSRIYTPNLFYYKDLNFLDAIIACRKGTKFEKNDYSYDTNSISEYNEPPIETTFIDEYEQIETDGVSPPSSPMPPQEAGDTEFKIKEQKQHGLSPYYSKLDAAVNTLAEVTKTSEDNLYTTFGKIVAIQLSQLSSIEATATMSEIHQMLSKNIIKSMISKNEQSCRTEGETEQSESRSIENKHHPNKFEEEVSIPY